jgi:hypothetical protein
MPQPRKSPLRRAERREASLESQIQRLRETVERAEAVLAELRALAPDVAVRDRVIRRRPRISIH